VVVGYLLIMLAGRQCLIAEVSMALGGDRIFLPIRWLGFCSARSISQSRAPC
jgi:hypothetical protein